VVKTRDEARYRFFCKQYASAAIAALLVILLVFLDEMLD